MLMTFLTAMQTEIAQQTCSSLQLLLYCREEARPSVFERLKADNEVKGHETRTKMRMDAVPASKITEAASPLYDPVTDTALPTIDMNMV